MCVPLIPLIRQFHDGASYLVVSGGHHFEHEHDQMRAKVGGCLFDKMVEITLAGGVDHLKNRLKV